MAMFDMNSDGYPDYDPITQDLFIYPESGVGNPVQWNTQCIAYEYREQLETRKAKPRQFTTDPPSPWDNRPVDLPANQRANWQNNEIPPALWFSENRGVWCDHYYSALPTRNPNLPLPVSGINHITQFLNLQNQIIVLDRLQILHPYNWYSDLAAVEYSGNLLQNKKFPKFANINEVSKNDFDKFMYIDSQDKVIFIEKENIVFQVTTFATDDVFNLSSYKINYGPLIKNDPRIMFTYTHDSGSQLFGIYKNDVYFLSSVLVAGSYPIIPFLSNSAILKTFENLSATGSNVIDPNFETIQLTKSKNPSSNVSDMPKQQTLDQIFSELNNIAPLIL